MSQLLLSEQKIVNVVELLKLKEEQTSPRLMNLIDDMVHVSTMSFKIDTYEDRININKVKGNPSMSPLQKKIPFGSQLSI